MKKTLFLLRKKASEFEPPSFLKPISDVEAVKHTCIKFIACITGNPLPSVEWFKNGQKLYNADRVQQINEAHGIVNSFFIRNKKKSLICVLLYNFQSHFLNRNNKIGY